MTWGGGFIRGPVIEAISLASEFNARLTRAHVNSRICAISVAEGRSENRAWRRWRCIDDSAVYDEIRRRSYLPEVQVSALNLITATMCNSP